MNRSILTCYKQEFPFLFQVGDELQYELQLPLSGPA